MAMGIWAHDDCVGARLLLVEARRKNIFPRIHVDSFEYPLLLAFGSCADPLSRRLRNRFLFVFMFPLCS